MNTPTNSAERSPAAPCSPSRDEKMSAMIEWLIAYHEGWYGPKSGWTKKQSDDFASHAGFLMLFIDGFKFTKENGMDQTASPAGNSNEGTEL